MIIVNVIIQSCNNDYDGGNKVTMATPSVNSGEMIDVVVTVVVEI
jgi:hypothetical protein